MGLFFLQFFLCCINMLICTPLQERAHFESIGHHLGKLGEEGKIGHRVIDLTRPEDLDGKVSFGFLSLSQPTTWSKDDPEVFTHNAQRFSKSYCKAKALKLSETSPHTRLFFLKADVHCLWLDLSFLSGCRNMSVREMWGLGWIPFEMRHGTEVFAGRWGEDKGAWGQSWLFSKLSPCCCYACLRSWAQGCKFGLHQCDKASSPFVVLAPSRERGAPLCSNVCLT